MAPTMTLATLRAVAAARTFALHESIEPAVRALGFVQADPIRAPARAQDLILRQRVEDYRAGDLERHYPSLALDEEMIHVHGFVPREHRALLYPRPLSATWTAFVQKHRALRVAVRRFMAQAGEAHPREVERAVGRVAAVNPWGSTSSASTMMLEALHRTGELRVARRDGGQRIYAVAPARARGLSPMRRAEELARLVATLYAPMPERSLRQALNMVHGPEDPHPREGLVTLVKRGELVRETVDGEPWIWPAGERLDREPATGPDARVRLLAPFDPVVWDRRRFEWLWGWQYRFEAYTPAPQRKLGYYALPMLAGDRVLGWATAQAGERGLDVAFGFAGVRPRDKAFRASLDEEIDRLKRFLAPRDPG